MIGGGGGGFGRGGGGGQGRHTGGATRALCCRRFSYERVATGRPGIGLAQAPAYPWFRGGSGGLMAEGGGGEMSAGWLFGRLAG